MNITIKFRLDNSAYQREERSGDAYHDLDYFAIAETIRKVADRVESEYYSHPIHDPNGNRVGEYAIED